LAEVGVDVVGLLDFGDVIVDDNDDLDFPNFMELVLQLRGSNQATVKDVVDLRKLMRNAHLTLSKDVAELKCMLERTKADATAGLQSAALASQNLVMANMATMQGSQWEASPYDDGHLKAAKPVYDEPVYKPLKAVPPQLIQLPQVEPDTKFDNCLSESAPVQLLRSASDNSLETPAQEAPPSPPVEVAAPDYVLSDVDKVTVQGSWATRSISCVPPLGADKSNQSLGLSAEVSSVVAKELQAHMAQLCDAMAKRSHSDTDGMLHFAEFLRCQSGLSAHMLGIIMSHRGVQQPLQGRSDAKIQ
jgi:hypothetical protein